MALMCKGWNLKYDLSQFVFYNEISFILIEYENKYDFTTQIRS